MNEEIAKQLRTLINTFNDKRVVSEGRMRETLSAIITILSENKKGVESLNTETKKQLQEALNYFNNSHKSVLTAVKSDLSKIKEEVEKSTKQQNDRAFRQLQALLDNVKLPKSGRDGVDGQPGKDGSPDNPVEVRNKLESLKDDERLDASAIKNLPQLIAKKGKEVLIGGVRFFENLADVSILSTKKRQDLIPQYNTTTNRWENGVAITVSATQPTNPQVGDLWCDIS